MAKYSTKQREILQMYLNRHAHKLLSAKQIAEDLQDYQISISAVYRNLADLEKEDKVRRYTQGGTRQVLYQYMAADACENKIHLSCKLCGKTFHLEEDTAQAIMEYVKKSIDFTIIPSDTVISGICSLCRKIK